MVVMVVTIIIVKVVVMIVARPLFLFSRLYGQGGGGVWKLLKQYGCPDTFTLLVESFH